MSTVIIKDLTTSTEMDRESMTEVYGGRMKIVGQPASGTLLTSADGDPVSVYVDGVLQNSVSDGYYHG
jgi:hypothetical protein